VNAATPHEQILGIVNNHWREGRQHPDRDAQFRYLGETVKRAQRRGQPAISVDTNYDPSGIIERVSPLARAE
jgi:hypothetical protein